MSSELTILKERFGFDEFRPGQIEAIRALERTGRALAVFPTGGGKSLCYELPALMFEGITLVVSPLIALMKDQIDFLRERGIAAARMDSSLTEEEAKEAAAQLRSGALKLLYVAPERFNNERFNEMMKRSRVSLFAIDEAHCISEWGHNFRPDYLKLAKSAKELGVERVLALTATATPAVVKDICAGFEIPVECAIVTGSYRPNLTIRTVPVTSGARDALLLERLSSRAPGPTIVYVTLQKTAARVSAQLQKAGFPAKAYHAGMESDERTAVQEWWKASNRNIVVATIAFGMGIDKADVRYVYHYNLPKSLESYSQEIGRAGRDGRPSIAEMLACPDDVPTLENFAYGDTPSERALAGLVEHLMSQEAEFDVNLHDLSPRFDIRILVLRTALTYLELLGFLRQGTPVYSTYKLKPLVPLNEIVGRFQGERARFVEGIFDQAKQGRVWYTLDMSGMAERPRVIRAIEYFEDHGWIEAQAADVRYQYSILRRPPNVPELVAVLARRFEVREQHEVRRARQVLELVEHDGCQTNALVAYFGESRADRCGHCTWCETGRRGELPAPRTLPALPAGLDLPAFQSLRKEYAPALGDARQASRFLCGLGSPGLTRFKLHRHELFGVFEYRPFAEVRAFCGEADAGP